MGQTRGPSSPVSHLQMQPVVNAEGRAQGYFNHPAILLWGILPALCSSGGSSATLGVTAFRGLWWFFPSITLPICFVDSYVLLALTVSCGREFQRWSSCLSCGAHLWSLALNQHLLDCKNPLLGLVLEKTIILSYSFSPLHSFFYRLLLCSPSVFAS